MRISTVHSPTRGQTTLEYLLLLAIVAVVVIASFGPGSLISKVHDSAQDYYNTVTRVIMGSGTDANPTPIKGDWCPITCPAAGAGFTNMYGACECPTPAFGGAFCPNVGVVVSCGPNQTCKGYEISCTGSSSCGSCPSGQQCLPSGGCGCANGLSCNPPPCDSKGVCAPQGSIPDSACGSCICPSGTIYDANSNSCAQQCPECTGLSGGSCVNICSGISNSFCDNTLSSGNPNYDKCQCFQGTTFQNGQCVYPSCTPNCNCAASTCVGGTCVNSCGTGTCPGTKTTGSCCVPNNCAASTCSTATCNNGCAVVSGTDTTGSCCVPNNCAASTCSTATCNNGCAVVSGTDTTGSCCVPNNCAASTCSTATCNNGCATVPGTDTTGSCCVPNNCAASTCSTATCNNGCATVPGTDTTGSCCVPNNCAASTCSTATCNNGCATVPGTDTTGSCCVPNNCAASTCSTATCNNGCAVVQGTDTTGQCAPPSCPSGTCGNPPACTPIPQGDCDCALDPKDVCGNCPGAPNYPVKANVCSAVCTGHTTSGTFTCGGACADTWQNQPGVWFVVSGGNVSFNPAGDCVYQQFTCGTPVPGNTSYPLLNPASGVSCNFTYCDSVGDCETNICGQKIPFFANEWICPNFPFAPHH